MWEAGAFLPLPLQHLAERSVPLIAIFTQDGNVGGADSEFLIPFFDSDSLYGLFDTGFFI